MVNSYPQVLEKSTKDGSDQVETMKQYIIALTNLYGQVPVSKVAEIYNSQNEPQVSTEEVEAYLDEDMSRDYVYSYKDHFVHETVMEFNMFKKLRKQKRKLPYYVPEKEELLKYADMLYYEKPKSYHKLQRNLTQHYFKQEPEKAEEIIETIEMLARSFLPGLRPSRNSLPTYLKGSDPPEIFSSAVSCKS